MPIKYALYIIHSNITVMLLPQVAIAVTSCNSVFTGLLQPKLELLQRLQNADARLVFNLRHRDHV